MREWSIRSLISYVCLGLAITAVLVGAKLGIEATPAGRKAESLTYEFLTRFLPRFRPDGALVTVIDTSHLQKTAAGAAGLSATPREQLLEIIKAAAAMRPIAIGIDIDFSPTANGWVQDADPKFFNECLGINKSVPIVLGVFRTVREPRAAWLGVPRYADLAGGMWLPDTGPERLPVWTQAPGVTDKLPTLAGALAAKAHAFANEAPSMWRQRFADRMTKTSDGFLVRDVLVDFSIVEQVDREVLKVSPADFIRHPEKFKNRIIIIGQSVLAPDRFVTPGLYRERAGILLHGAIVNTLASEPIWELTHSARITIDVVLSIVLIVAVILLSRKFGGSTHAAIEKAEVKALRYMVAATVIVGCGLVVYFRLLWIDLFLVALALYLHPRIAQKLNQTKLGKRLLHDHRKTTPEPPSAPPTPSS